MKIRKIDALEVLDSRGIPTIRAYVELSFKKKTFEGSCSVPSGKSRGQFEAVEIRDDDKKRYLGNGLLLALENVGKISEKLVGKRVNSHAEFDEMLLNLDPTPQKKKMGGNVILGLSVAFAKALSAAHDISLYKLFRAEYDQLVKPARRLRDKYGVPIPMFNIYNGGAHADNGISIQEFMVIPNGIKEYREQLRAGVEIYQTLRQALRLEQRTTGVGDEGGFSARWENDVKVLDLLVDAIERAGYKPGKEIGIGLDVAATQFYRKDERMYVVPNWGDNGIKGQYEELARFYWEITSNYPILYIEDPFSEDDWASWTKFSTDLSKKTVGIFLVGDDLTVTQEERIEKAVSLKAINGMIVKPNQVGSIKETLAACGFAAENDIELFAGHRSGDTSDSFLSDLAVGAGCAYIKAGAPARSERTVKYNRLLEIEKEISAK